MRKKLQDSDKSHVLVHIQSLISAIFRIDGGYRSPHKTFMSEKQKI